MQERSPHPLAAKASPAGKLGGVEGQGRHSVGRSGRRSRRGTTPPPVATGLVVNVVIPKLLANVGFSC